MRLANRAGTPLSRLSDLMWEVRALAREADKRTFAQCADRRQLYAEQLESVLDAWMSAFTGRELLVCFGAALELGIIPERHIVRCIEAAGADDARDVRALFWAGMRRVSASRRASVRHEACVHS
ncbi:hypothetical protein [Cupriavidus basilensis]|uniref:hypothetical protein n=1 Tax=Cupriavidus basilensis TaxID=68895 RepID=UPI0011468C8E|nr:hypothetical protein [Cupriavidus basilensis]